MSTTTAPAPKANPKPATHPRKSVRSPQSVAARHNPNRTPAPASSTPPYPTPSPTTPHPLLPSLTTPEAIALAPQVEALALQPGATPHSIANTLKTNLLLILAFILSPRISTLRNLLDLQSLLTAERQLLELIHTANAAAIALSLTDNPTQEQRRRVGTLNNTIRHSTQALTALRARFDPERAEQLQKLSKPQRAPRTNNKPKPTTYSNTTTTPIHLSIPTPTPTHINTINPAHTNSHTAANPQPPTHTNSNTTNTTPDPFNTEIPLTRNPNTPHPLRNNPRWTTFARTLPTHEFNIANQIEPETLLQLLNNPQHLRKRLKQHSQTISTTTPAAA